MSLLIQYWCLVQETGEPVEPMMKCIQIGTDAIPHSNARLVRLQRFIQNIEYIIFGGTHMAFSCPLLMTSVHFLVQFIHIRMPCPGTHIYPLPCHVDSLLPSMSDWATSSRSRQNYKCHFTKWWSNQVHQYSSLFPHTALELRNLLQSLSSPYSLFLLVKSVDSLVG